MMICCFFQKNTFALLPIFCSKDFKKNLDQINFSANTMSERDRQDTSVGSDAKRRARDRLADQRRRPDPTFNSPRKKPMRSSAASTMPRGFTGTSKPQIVVLVGTSEKARTLMKRVQTNGYPYATPISLSY